MSPAAKSLRRVNSAAIEGKPDSSMMASFRRN
jgi:hypothetical protein